VKKLLLVWGKALSDARPIVFGGGIAVFAIMLLHIVVYPEYGDLEAMQYPEAISGLFGEAGSIALVEGYIAAVATNSLTLVAVLAVIAGTGATAGEEGAGTLDLMLAQPLKRSVFLAGKALGLAVALTLILAAAVPAFLLGDLRADLPVPVLDFAIAMASLVPAALVFLALAILLSVSLPTRAMATTLASAAVVAAYFVNAAGTVGPLETVRNLSPFYWADPSHVLFDGFDWLRSLCLTLVALGFLALSLVAINRRDIASGRREARPLLAALRPRREARTAATRLGGSYSRGFGIARKSTEDIKWAIISSALASFAFALLLFLIYPSYRDALKDFEYPGALEGLLGEAGSFASPEGFMSGEFFGFVPLVLIVVAIILGTAVTAGEEGSGTLDTVLAQPVSRRRLILEKSLPIVLGLALAAAAGIPGFVVGRLFVDMDLDFVRFSLAVLNTALLAICFFALSLATAVILPTRGAAVMATSAAVLIGYLLNTLSYTLEWLQLPNKLSPFYWADGSHVLVSGFDPPRTLALLVVTAAIFVLALLKLEGRDIVTGRREWSLRSLLGRRVKASADTALQIGGLRTR
jgi:ABC-2 type transport system permease protein